MPEIKLPKLPDRTPARLTVTLPPDLKNALDDYRLVYNRQYGADEPLSELVPHMLSTFLAADRTFAKARDELKKAGGRDG